MLLYNVKKNIENGHILRKEGDLNAEKWKKTGKKKNLPDKRAGKSNRGRNLE